MIKSLENSFNKCLVVVFFLGISYITIRYLYHNYEKEKNLTYDSILSLQSTLKPVSVACARPALFLLEYCHLWIKLWTYFSLHLSRYLSLSLALTRSHYLLYFLAFYIYDILQKESLFLFGFIFSSSVYLLPHSTADLSSYGVFQVWKWYSQKTKRFLILKSFPKMRDISDKSPWSYGMLPDAHALSPLSAAVSVLISLVVCVCVVFSSRKNVSSVLDFSISYVLFSLKTFKNLWHDILAFSPKCFDQWYF